MCLKGACMSSTNFIFGLSASITGKMKYKSKFILLFVLFALPLGIISSLEVADLSREIDHTQSKRQGLQYLNTIRPLLAHMPQHRGLTNGFLNGNTGVRDAILKKRTEVDGYLADLEAFDAEIDDFHGIHEELADIRATWESLKRDSFDGQAPEIFARHSAMIDAVIELSKHVADQSRLNLDQDLAVHYLVDAIELRIPVITNTMGKVRGLSTGIAASGQWLTTEQKETLALLIDRADVLVTDLEYDVVVIRENAPEISSALQGLDDQALQALSNFTLFIQNELLLPGEPTKPANEYFDNGTAAIASSFALFDAMVPVMDQLLANRENNQQMLLTISVLVMVVALLLVIWIFGGMALSINKSIDELNEATTRLAEGDLQYRTHLEVDDEIGEIGQDFNNMADQMASVMRDVTGLASDVAQGAEMLSQSTAKTSADIKVQQAETHQASVGMDQMSSAIAEITDNTHQSSDAAESANGHAVTGQKVVEEVVGGIIDLANEVEQAADLITQVGENSETISTVLDVIKGIAEQTNLLALNAAIEAARAGEQGRGFAVVADEVRTLASRTAESTEEINQIIERLQSGSGDAVRAMTVSREKAQQLSEQASNASSTLSEIAESVARINQMSGDIAVAAEEQNAVTESMKNSVDDINKISVKNMASSANTQQTGEALAQTATQLAALVSRFKV